MDFNDFWDIYLEKDITTISDLVIDVFNQELSKNIDEEYDLGELITEFTGHHETAKKYDKIEVFGEALKTKQPQLYHNKEGDYINESLIKFYCFTNNDQKLQTQIQDFTSRDYDYDLLLQSFRQLFYNQYIKQANQIIEQEYNNVKDSSTLFEGAEFDLAIVKFYIELEHLYLENKDISNVDITPFKETTNQYGFDVNEQYCNHIKIGLFNNSEDTIQNLLKEFPEDRSYIMATIEMHFLKLMQSKNCPFPIAGMIWINLFQYFEGNSARNWNDYFTFKPVLLKEFINSKSGFFVSNKIEIALILWGSSYFIDFVHQKQIIDNEKYLDQKDIIEKFKYNFKKNNKYNLWEYNFIHKWQPDVNTTLEDWKVENDEFESSYYLEDNHDEHNHQKFNQFLEEPFREEKISNLKSKPIRNTTKIGRNEKISVKYNDGTIKEDIKYKKVLNDINNGDCTII